MTAPTATRPLSVLGISFQNPILLAAGTAGFGRELAGTIDLESLGGIVTKAISLEPRSGNPPPRVAEFPGGMLNAVGLANPGLERVLAGELPWLAARVRGPRIVANVVGFTETEYGDVVRRLEAGPAIAAYEINLSCPNTSAGGLEFGADPAAVGRIVAGCRRETARPLFAKLSPTLPDIPALAARAVEAGADGITVVNTMPGFLFEGDRPRLGNGNGGVSGPALLPVGLLATARVRQRLPGVAIIGVGGVSTLEHVEQYRTAGADLVGIGTAALADPRLPERLAQAWMERHG